MEDFVWRLSARKVAIANMVILTLVLFMSIIIKDTEVDENSFVSQVFNNKDLKGKDEDVLTMVSLFVFAVVILLIVLGFWGAVTLLRASDKGRDPQNAYGLAQSWQIVFLIYILLGCVYMLMFKSFWLFMVQLALLITALAFMYIVLQFMKELKAAILANKAEVMVTVAAPEDV